MEKENIVRTIEVIGTAIALAIAVSILAPTHDASANHPNQQLHKVDQKPSLIEHYAIDL